MRIIRDVKSFLRSRRKAAGWLEAAVAAPVENLSWLRRRTILPSEPSAPFGIGSDFSQSRWNPGTTPRPAAVPGTLLRDTFTDSDEVNLINHVMDVGPGWKANSGTFKIISNQAVGNSNADDDHIVADAGQSDVYVSCRVTPRDGIGWENDPDIVLRSSSAGNHWLIHITSSGNSIQLIEVTGGSGAVVATAGFAFASGTAYEILAILSGANIEVFVNGTSLLNYATATFNQTATNFGLRVGQSGTVVTKCQWDNFNVYIPGDIVFPGKGKHHYAVEPELNIRPFKSWISEQVAPTAPDTTLVFNPRTRLPVEPVVFERPVIQRPWLGEQAAPATPDTTLVFSRRMAIPEPLPPPESRPSFKAWISTQVPATVDTTVVFLRRNWLKDVADPRTSDWKPRLVPVVPPWAILPRTTKLPLLGRVPNANDSPRRAARFTELLSVAFNALVRRGHIQQEGQEWYIRGGGFEEAVAPGPLDDAAIGATVGCTWVNTATGDCYICVNATLGAAIWKLVS